ncbi:MAG: kinase/pyrophosphorylase [Firmicutes bacterium]|nr:kinase/pyrophosphorylase [Alicyclobacillaceae bacterium]MCL6496927.1 kinase/pyrophosphorylase [Bacillota bacterium]
MTPSEPRGHATVFVVSDSLGETAERVAAGALVQFEDRAEIRLERVTHVSSAEGLDQVVERAARHRPAVIVFTLVRPEWRRYLQEAAARQKIAAVDILGPMLDSLEAALGVAPRLVPGLTHRLDREYFARVEAIEFAVKYDDGRDPRAIRQADLILLGVSRTSKTPVSLYLANHRLKVANIPLVPEVPVPPELFVLGRDKTVGLTIEPELLVEIRRQRLKSLGLEANAQYATLERILVELDYAWDIYAQLKCPVVDVSNHAVEETANRVLEIMRQGGKRV